MSKTNMDLRASGKARSDFLRSLAEAVLQPIMEADVEGLIGAAARAQR